MELNQIENYIRQTAKGEPEDIMPIGNGLSKAVKCKVTIFGQDWMAKITPGTFQRAVWYRELSKRSNDQMESPKIHRLFHDGNICLLSHWITGKSLEEKLKDATQDQIRNYATQAAKILLHLHEESLEYPSYSKLLTNRILSVCDQIDEFGLTFPGHKDCCSFMKEAVKMHEVEHACFVHQDIRPENFIVHEGKLVLIDFENGGLGERAADFSYLTTMGRPEHRIFSRMLIETYLQNIENQTFWRDNLLYSTLHVVEYAIWKWKTTGKQMRYQAENLLQQYDHFHSYQPHWWRT